MTAYYNENDPAAAAWLRELIASGLIAPGVVDERSIRDVQPNDLKDFAQCHFFAGIGGWSLALRLAGWPDTRPAWTGSCPCQPFSAAGEGAGFADERHLWPAWARLIAQRRPPVVFGEQVASAAAEPWIDLVHADLESMDYAIGCIPFPAAGIGAPHIRDRLYWVADGSEHAVGDGPQGRVSRGPDSQRGIEYGSAGRDRAASRLADHDRNGRAAQSVARLHDAERDAESRGGIGRLANAIDSPGVPVEPRPIVGELSPCLGAVQTEPRPADPLYGFWAGADWLGCRDGKFRPVEPGTFPLAYGLPRDVVRIRDSGAPINVARTQEARVMRLRGYGNAIVPQQAAEFISAYIEASV